MPTIVEIVPKWIVMTERSARSIDPRDYQGLPQPIGAMSKSFADGFVIPLHSHARDQLLHARRGIMRLRTEGEAWIVPPDGAVYIPAGTPHAVDMHGDVDMRLRTEGEAWIVPPDGAVYIPAGTPHAVDMHGDVDMRTLYIDG